MVRFWLDRNDVWQFLVITLYIIEFLALAAEKERERYIALHWFLIGFTMTYHRIQIHPSGPSIWKLLKIGNSVSLLPSRVRLGCGRRAAESERERETK